MGNLKLVPAKKAIQDYKKASGDLIGTLDLMLYYVEQGTKFTLEYGDIDEPFYNSLESVLYDFKNLLQSKDEEYIDIFKERLLKLRKNSYWIGWGYGDSINDVVFDILES